MCLPTSLWKSCTGSLIRESARPEPFREGTNVTNTLTLPSETAQPAGIAVAGAAPPPISEWKRIFSGIGPLFWICAGWIFLICLAALFAFQLPLKRYGHYDTNHLSAGFSSRHWLGSNNEGDDLLGLCIQGARISLIVGFIRLSIAFTW